MVFQLFIHNAIRIYIMIVHKIVSEAASSLMFFQSQWNEDQENVCYVDIINSGIKSNEQKTIWSKMFGFIILTTYE